MLGVRTWNAHVAALFVITCCACVALSTVETPAAGPSGQCTDERESLCQNGDRGTMLLQRAAAVERGTEHDEDDALQRIAAVERGTQRDENDARIILVNNAMDYDFLEDLDDEDSGAYIQDSDEEAEFTELEAEFAQMEAEVDAEELGQDDAMREAVEPQKKVALNEIARQWILQEPREAEEGRSQIEDAEETVLGLDDSVAARGVNHTMAKLTAKALGTSRTPHSRDEWTFSVPSFYYHLLAANFEMVVLFSIGLVLVVLYCARSATVLGLKTPWAPNEWAAAEQCPHCGSWKHGCVEAWKDYAKSFSRRKMPF